MPDREVNSALMIKHTLKMSFLCLLLALACAFTACAEVGSVRVPALSPSEPPAATEIANPKIRKLLESAEEQLEVTTGYTQDYFTIAYPNGDVPAETGACGPASTCRKRSTRTCGLTFASIRRNGD